MMTLIVSKLLMAMFVSTTSNTSTSKLISILHTIPYHRLFV